MCKTEVQGVGVGNRFRIFKQGSQRTEKILYVQRPEGGDQVSQADSERRIFQKKYKSPKGEARSWKQHVVCGSTYSLHTSVTAKPLKQNFKILHQTQGFEGGNQILIIFIFPALTC